MLCFDESIFPFADLHPNAGDMNNSDYVMTIALLEPLLSGADLVPAVSSNKQQVSAQHLLSAPIFPACTRISFPSEQHDNTGVVPDFGLGGRSEADPSPTSQQQTLPPEIDSPGGLQQQTMLPVDPSPSVPDVESGLAFDLPSVTSPPAAVPPSVPEVPPVSNMAPGSSSVDTSAVSERCTRLPPSPNIVRPIHGPIPVRPRTHLQDNIRKPKIFTDGTVCYGLLCDQEPGNLDEAFSNEHWRRAMDVKFDDLQRNNTWHLVPPAPGSNIVLT
jgi:hypothetical protein